MKMVTESLFTIGELAKRAGVGVQTIRYYERRRLLLPTGRKKSGYRLYDEGALKRLVFIRSAKEMGFTLKETGELLALRISVKGDCDKAKRRAEAKLGAVEAKLSSLESVRRVLRELVTACERRRPTDKCPILKAIEKGR